MTYAQALDVLAHCIKESDGMLEVDVTVETVVSRDAFAAFNSMLRSRITPEPKTPTGMQWFRNLTVRELLAQLELEPEAAAVA